MTGDNCSPLRELRILRYNRRYGLLARLELGIVCSCLLHATAAAPAGSKNGVVFSLPRFVECPPCIRYIL